MTPRTIVITGASDGVGAAAARILAERDERVVLVGRSPDKTRALARELDAPAHLADFADLAQVRRLAEELRAYPRIDVLANNAGAIMGARRVTRDGFEATFQVNHLAPFLLTHLLIDRLEGAKVVQTSSAAARRFARLDLEDLQNERHYSPNRAYGDAKLANILFTVELHRRYPGVAAVAFHPGMIATSFAAGSSSWFRWVYRTPLARLVLEPPARGGERLVWLVDGTPGRDWTPGAYYEKNLEAVPPPLAADPDVARALWDRSAALVGLTTREGPRSPA
ncbi:SDR family NAD(P)-dependent oxidoreductase [Cellulomonas sp. DKR-3]|uniref:SDR family NAD(P)-dependent oxidoreductase n=1 Tax=Cellulomonas fulva TaxID=2835530 RepID=A0ABS5TX45_9CELL|nr:SDR family NAD(P)-dependent oxidoreductase [Cellulomonas fulva]MBT0993719.1 SDR family NAD(P)-dependent oxidoreductase [Cellulomonas fulva]